MSDTGYWEIWIDDICGELAMEKTDLANRKIDVVEAEAYEEVLKDNSRLKDESENMLISARYYNNERNDYRKKYRMSLVAIFVWTVFLLIKTTRV